MTKAILKSFWRGNRIKFVLTFIYLLWLMIIAKPVYITHAYTLADWIIELTGLPVMTITGLLPILIVFYLQIPEFYYRNIGPFIIARTRQQSALIKIILALIASISLIIILIFLIAAFISGLLNQLEITFMTSHPFSTVENGIVTLLSRLNTLWLNSTALGLLGFSAYLVSPHTITVLLTLVTTNLGILLAFKSGLNQTFLKFYPGVDLTYASYLSHDRIVIFYPVLDVLCLTIIIIFIYKLAKHQAIKIWSQSDD